jgi:hypothetical protein
VRFAVVRRLCEVEHREMYRPIILTLTRAIMIARTWPKTSKAART